MKFAHTGRIHAGFLALLTSITIARSVGQVVEIQPSSVGEGKFLIENGEYEKSLERFMSVPPSSPEYVRALAGTLISSITLREPQTAMRASEELSRQTPLDGECHKMRGLLLLMLDRNNAKEALVSLEEAHRLMPDEETLFLMAGCHAYIATPQDGASLSAEIRAPELQLAIRFCNELISSDTKDYRYFFLRGYCLFEQGDFDSALQDLLHAEPLVPNEGREQYRWFIANVALKAIEEPLSTTGGSKEKCLVHLNTAISKCPYWARLYHLRGMVRAEYLNDPVGGIADYTMAIELQSKSDTSYLLRSRAYLQQLMLDKAIGDIDAAFSLCETPSDLHYLTRAEIRLRACRFDEALSDSTEALRLETTPSARAYFVRALAWEGIGKNAEASGDRAKGTSLLTQCETMPVPKEQLEVWKRLAPTAEERRRVQFFVLSPTHLAEWLRGKLK